MVVLLWVSTDSLLDGRQSDVCCVCSICGFPSFLSLFLKNHINGLSEGITTEAVMETCPLLLRDIKYNNKLISFMALLLMAFVLSDFERRASYISPFKETCFLVITRFFVGFFLPVIVIDMIDSSHEEENGRKVSVIYW